jgi:hypothetical protein
VPGKSDYRRCGPPDDPGQVARVQCAKKILGGPALPIEASGFWRFFHLPFKQPRAIPFSISHFQLIS